MKPRKSNTMNTFFRGLAVLSVLASLAPTPPLQAQVGSPSLGALFDSANGAVHPVPGIPGLARVGPALDLEAPIRTAAYSPDKDYVLAAPASDTALLVVDGSGVRSFRTLDAFGQVALSPNGTYAALIDTAGRRLVVVSGLPGNPEFIVRAWFPAYYGKPGSIAVSDQGVILTTYFDSGVVLSLSAENSSRRATFRLMGSFGRVAAMAFLPGRPDAVIADDAVHALYLVRDVEGNATRTIIADGSDGVDRPVAVAVSEDGKRFFLADSGAGGVLVASETGRASTVPCPCTPSALSPLQGSSVFALTSPGSESTVWVLNGGTEQPTVHPAPAQPTVTGP
jgi:hypothetical protein